MKSDPKILLVKLGAVGDVAHTLPTLHALRRRFPKAYIAWAVEPKSFDLIAGHPEIDEILVFERKKFAHLAKRPWLWPRLIAEIISFVRRMRRIGFDIAIDGQTLFKSGLITRLSGAPLRIGFDRWREFNRVFTNRRVPADGSQSHAARQYLTLAEAAGAEAVLDWVSPTTDTDNRRVIDSWIAQNNITETLICINPGASWPTKLWPPQNFAEAGKIVTENTGARAVVVWGPGELEVAEQIVEQIGPNAILAPPTRLRELAYLLSRSALLISSDTGPAHIAAAVGTPVVAIYGPSNPLRNGPLDKQSIVLRADLDCLDCWKHKCNCDPLPCMSGVTAKRVADAAKKIFDQRSGPQTDKC